MNWLPINCKTHFSLLKAFSKALIDRTGKNIPLTVLGRDFNNSTTLGDIAIVLGLSALVS